VERLSGETGFAPATLEKVLRLERLLDQVSRHPFLGSRLDLFDQAQIERELVPLLRNGTTPLVEELRGPVRRFLAALLNLSVGEKRYVEGLQWGEFEPELIGGSDRDLAERLRRHPAILWKVENARRRPRR
jgi:hypothetical protein